MGSRIRYSGSRGIGVGSAFRCVGAPREVLGASLPVLLEDCALAPEGFGCSCPGSHNILPAALFLDLGVLPEG
jgi:hypothetical protein